MKIRTNFISNSSSSSFIIYGTRISEEDLKKYAEDKYFDNKEYQKVKFSEVYDLVEFLECNDSLEIISNYDCEDYYIGRSFHTIGDNETGKQFKDSVENQLKQVFEDVKCRTLDITISS